MTPATLATACRDAMAQPGQCGVTLTIEKGRMPRGFPRGELLNELERLGVVERTYSFDPVRLLAWLVKNELLAADER